MPASEASVVTFETTAGNLVVALDPDAAPVTCANFMRYVRAGFYAGLVFHRVVPGFVAQGGGFAADGSGKPPLYPPIKFESSALRHLDGAFGMARLQEPNTATSEFYFCDGPQRELDRVYCIFGRLIEGRDALTRILAIPTKPNDWPTDPPVIFRAYEGMPDPENPAPRFEVSSSPKPEDVDTNRKAARRLRGRAAMLRARRPMMAFGEIEKAIARADHTGKKADLDTAERMLDEKDKARR